MVFFYYNLFNTTTCYIKVKAFIMQDRIRFQYDTFSYLFLNNS